VIGIRQPALRAVRLLAPRFDEQLRIAGVLGALDDKIAANTKLAATLTETLELETGLRWLSSDGDLIPVTELFDVNPRTSRPVEDKPVYVDMKKLPESGIGIADWDYREAKGGARFVQGDTLLGRITPCLENRKTGFVDFLEDGQVGIGSTEFIVLRAQGGVPSPMSYFLAVDPDFRDFAIRHMAGTSGRQRVAASDLATYLIPRPDDEWLIDFGGRATDTFAFLKSLRAENRTLAATRDALLPQLMSGKLRVRELHAAKEA
jgi:type I restriction enzyme S subunit